MIKQAMAWSLYEAFEKDRLRRAHMDQNCNPDECPYCHIARKNDPQLTSEMIETDNDFSPDAA